VLCRAGDFTAALEAATAARQRRLAVAAGQRLALAHALTASPPVVAMPARRHQRRGRAGAAAGLRVLPLLPRLLCVP
jgi:hypothetical protein